jgi:hypothetical protein
MKAKKEINSFFNLPLKKPKMIWRHTLCLIHFIIYVILQISVVHLKNKNKKMGKVGGNMKIKVNLNLKELLSIILQTEPRRRYAVAVIDNTPPTEPQLPLIGKDFIWIHKIEQSIPMNQELLEKLFLSYDIKIEEGQSIAVFHHHDLSKSYVRIKNTEYYEFSHVPGLTYEAFCHADTTLLSHMLSKTFHKYDKVKLVKAGLAKSEVQEIQKKYWIFETKETLEEKEISKEEFTIYSVALKLAGSNIVPDLKRYRPKIHNKLIKTGLKDQYAIPAMFKEIEIETGTRLDEKIVKRIKLKKYCPISM